MSHWEQRAEAAWKEYTRQLEEKALRRAVEEK